MGRRRNTRLIAIITLLAMRLFSNEFEAKFILVRTSRNIAVSSLGGKA